MLFGVSSLGLFASAVVHFSTHSKMNLTTQPLLMVVLHVGALLTVGGFVVIFHIDKPPVSQQVFFREVLFKPIWPLLLILLLSGYVVYNFANNAGAGNFSQRQGKYVETMRGRILRSFPDKKTFERERAAAGLRTTRAFSGHWLLFYGAIWVLLFSARLRREDLKELALAQKHEYQQQFQRTKDDLQRGHSALSAIEESYSFSQRFWNYRPVKLLTFVMVGQILVVGGGFFWLSGEWGVPLFIVLFLGFGLGVNLFHYRTELRYFLQELRFEEGKVVLEYYDYEEHHRLRLPVVETHLELHEKKAKGGTLVYLEIKHQQEKVLRLLCNEKGLWTRARCEAIIDEWEKRQHRRRSSRTSRRRR